MNQTTTDYLDFDTAVTYLNTTSSTLYKWLQSGKVPAHKLGRQWRFSKTELDQYLSHSPRQPVLENEVRLLIQNLNIHSKSNTVSQFIELFILHNFNQGIRVLQIRPRHGRFEIVRRTRQGLSISTEISFFLQEEIKKYFLDCSYEVTEPNDRRFFINFEEKAFLQIRLQLITTLSGDIMTLNIYNSEKDVLPIEKISSGSEAVEMSLKRWCRKPSGLIVVTGDSGSGKTTTIYSLMKECLDLKMNVFSIEESAHMLFEGVNQIEIGLNPTKLQFNQTLLRIMNSDPDVITLGLGSYSQLEEELVRAADQLVTSGHKVILQLQKTSLDKALDFLTQTLGIEKAENLLTGIVFQKLVFSDNKLTADYKLFEGKRHQQ